MSKYLKLFETTSDYETYINGGGVVLPNVSVAKDAPKIVYFNPWVEPPFFVKLSLNNGEVIELQGSGELTYEMVLPYKSSVVSAEIGKLCTSLGDNAFYQCEGLTSITIGNSVITIGFGAFDGCRGLTSITISNSVTSISAQAFKECSGLTNITIPNGVTSIGDAAFWASGLTSVTIGSGVTSIGDMAFADCYYLTSITSLATTAPTISSNTFNSIKTGGTLTVPNDSTGYDVWMSTDYSYLGYYNWTKVEQ